MRSLSYQLYSSRKFAPWANVFEMLKSVGYQSVEGFGALYGSLSEAKDLRESLDALGLTMPTGHMALDQIEASPGQVMEMAGELGIETVIVPFLMPQDRPATAAGWQELGGRLGEAASTLRKAGFDFAYHNHDFELQPLSTGEVPLDLLLQADPYIGWEADLAWVARGGADPMAWLERHADRMVALHIKDIAPEGDCLDEDGWADVGQGTMDWPGLLRAAGGTGCKHFIVEHDNPADDGRFARRSFAALGLAETNA